MVRGHYSYVLAYARRRVGEDEAQDVVADVFLVAWRHVGQLPAEPLPWLYRAAYHAVLNSRRRELRANRLHRRMSDLAPADSADHADGIAETSRVRQALARLSIRDQEALRLTSWEDLSVSDVAAVMGTSTGAMKVRLHRARRLLARLLDEGEGASALSEQPATRPDPPPTSWERARLSPAIKKRTP